MLVNGNANCQPDEEIKVKERERGFSESVYLLAIVWNLILGGECVDDLNVLRGDPGTLRLIEMERLPTPRATGKFLRRFQIGDVRALRLIQERAHGHLLKWLPVATCTIDLDSSIFEQWAKKREGCFRNQFNVLRPWSGAARGSAVPAIQAKRSTAPTQRRKTADPS